MLNPFFYTANIASQFEYLKPCGCEFGHGVCIKYLNGNNFTKQIFFSYSFKFGGKWHGIGIIASVSKY